MALGGSSQAKHGIRTHDLRLNFNMPETPLDGKPRIVLAGCMAVTAKPFGVTWPEGQPEKARVWHTHLGKWWAEMWGGLLTYLPTPLHARRMCSTWWWEAEIDGTPIEVAQWWDKEQHFRGNR